MMRGYLPALLVVACLLPGVTTPASAQRALLIPGTHLRIGGVLEGVMTRRTADTLYVLTDEGADVAIALRELETIDISNKLDRGAGARAGALLGTAAGAAGGLIIWLGGFETDAPFGSRKATPGDAALFTAIGLIAGTVYGAAQGKHVWQTIAVQPQVSVLVEPGGRVGVAFGLPW